MAKAKCIGILTSGGDCTGLNAAIRGIAKPAMRDFHIEVIGIYPIVQSETAIVQGAVTGNSVLKCVQAVARGQFSG